jgi:hypothetical protein
MNVAAISLINDLAQATGMGSALSGMDGNQSSQGAHHHHHHKNKSQFDQALNSLAQSDPSLLQNLPQQMLKQLEQIDPQLKQLLKNSGS